MLVIAAIYILLSLVTFIVYAWDKRAAGRGNRRTPEKTLHTLELLGGWPGAIVAVKTLRHKSSKPRFQVILGLISLLHIAAWSAWFFLR